MQPEVAEPDLRRSLEDRQVRVIVLVIQAAVSGRRGERAQPGTDAVW